MLNTQITTTARAVVVRACLGIACVALAAACQAVAKSAPPSTASSGSYGDPAAAAKYWQQQSLEDNCGLVSVADVVGEITGQSPTEEQMIVLAEKTPSGTNPGPIYAPRDDPSHTNGNGGIEMADEVVLLDHYGIKSVMTYAAHPDQTGLPALEQYLTNGRKIIAWVNSAIIWNTNDQRANADHFLVVTGIDANKEMVHLNDPGADHADEQVSITTFTNAWRTGEESIVVTAATS